MKRVWLTLLWAPLLAAQVVPDLYIVQLSGPPAAAVAARKKVAVAAAVDRRVEIRREQAALRADVRQLGAEVLDAVDTVANALIVRAPGLQASELANLAGVARVYPVRVVKALLDHAVPLHKVPDAWQALGGKDNAGAGLKIGVLDTGIDNTHPGFQDSSLQMPAGFPKADNDADLALTNSKIIVARNYTRESDATDRFGHGTATAMAAAGATNTGPRGPITGVAPKAYIGNYRVLNSSGSGSDAGILKALDDAVADGMDVVNMSFGILVAPRPGDDPDAQAIEVAASAGVLVVVSAGNDGDSGPETISSPATAASAIAVGASRNDRRFATAAVLDGVPPYLASPTDRQPDNDQVSGPLADVTQFDPSGLACNPLPDKSLTGKIAFILRGTCNFSVKLDTAQNAGAIGALLYTDSSRPDVSALIMAVGDATLPAAIVSNADGLDIKSRLGANPDLNLSLRFNASLSADPNGIASFSSHGPDVDQTIKPDLLAVGTTFYTATQKNNPDSSTMYDPSGYTVEQGTSFSAPLVSGAVALVKQARPGLNVRQYRSLLINSASPLLPTGASQPAAVQVQGAGVLNVAAALQNPVAAFPTSVSFGWGGGTADLFRDLTLTNLGAAADTFAISLAPVGNGPAPSLSTSSVQLDPGASQKVTLEFSANALDAGEYQGFVQVQGTQSQVSARIPYWYGVASGTARYLTVLHAADTGAPSTRQTIYFRVNDSAGVPLSVGSYTPQVTVLSGGGTVLNTSSVDQDIPDAYAVEVRLGPASGANVVQIQVGDVTAAVHILATSHP